MLGLAVPGEEEASGAPGQRPLAIRTTPPGMYRDSTSRSLQSPPPELDSACTPEDQPVENQCVPGFQMPCRGRDHQRAFVWRQIRTGTRDDILSVRLLCLQLCLWMVPGFSDAATHPGSDGVAPRAN
jgi:hypothetical protein